MPTLDTPSSDLRSSDFLDHAPCAVCDWQRDCPPCDMTVLISPADSSDIESDDCFVSDFVGANSEAFHTMREKDTAGLWLFGVIQFPWRRGAFQGFDSVEKHSRIQLFWDSLGKLHLVHGKPEKHNDRPGVNDPVLWRRDSPEFHERFCISSDSDDSDKEVSETRETSTVVVSWFAFHGNFEGDRQSSDGPSEFSGLDDDGCASTSSLESTDFSGDAFGCNCYVPVWAPESRLNCIASSDKVELGLSADEELVGSEVAAEFDSTGRLMRAYWGGLESYKGPSCEWWKEKIHADERNCLKWSRDNPKPDESGVIIPITTQRGIAGGLEHIFDIWGLHFDCLGGLIKICLIATLSDCEFGPPDISSEPGYCPCENVCLRINYTQQSATPPPQCPPTLSYGCPGAQKLQPNLCLGWGEDDGKFCLYEFSAGQTLDCISSEIGSGTHFIICPYKPVVLGCV